VLDAVAVTELGAPVRLCIDDLIVVLGDLATMIAVMQGVHGHVGWYIERFIHSDWVALFVCEVTSRGGWFVVQRVNLSDWAKSWFPARV